MLAQAGACPRRPDGPAAGTVVVMRGLRAAALTAAVVLLAGGCSRPAGEQDVTAVWFDRTAEVVAALGGPDPVATRTWALAWWAADRAAERSADPDGALAAAVHDVLVALAPDRREALDETLEAGDHSEGGLADGRREAAAVLAERAGDGLTVAEVNRPYTPKPAAPGTYRPTPPDLLPGQQAGQGDAKPLLLTALPDPGPPVRPGSARYATDLAEVRRLGEREGSDRTAEQTEVARFWAPSLVTLYTDVLRPFVGPLDARAAAELLGDFHRVSLDAQLATYRAKYVYEAWRPVTALREDGLAGWTPLLDTPPQPEFPSGHTAYAAAAASVLQARLGDRRSVLTVAGVTRRFDGWDQLVQENVDGRVWGGVHLRSSDEVGAALGYEVAASGLARLAQ